MSTATELAELDAACAEAELTDEETEVVRGGVAEGVPLAEAIALVREARDEAAAEANGKGKLAGEVTDEQLQALDKAKGQHLRTVRRILGDVAEGLAECEACDGMGIAPPGDPAPEPKAHEYFRACETCGALGQVLTGSKVAGNVFRACPNCGGRGYEEALDATGAALAESTQPPAALGSVRAPSEAELATGTTAVTETEPRFGRPAWMGDPAIGA